MALHIELFSNARQVFRGLATKVVLPTQKGRMEVLPHHTAFVVNLAPGMIVVHGEDKKPTKVQTTTGVAYKTEENVTILIEEIPLHTLK